MGMARVEAGRPQLFKGPRLAIEEGAEILQQQ